MKFWLKYVKPYWHQFLLGPICMIIEVAGEMFMPLYMALVMDHAENKGVAFCLGVTGLMILTALVMMVGGIGGAYYGAKASVNFSTDLRADVYRKVQSFSFGNIDRFSTGSLVTRLTNDVTQLQNFVAMLLRMALRSPGMLIGGIIMAVMLKPRLSIILAVSVPLLLLSISGIILRGFSRFSKVQSKLDGLNSTVQENITNVRVVKSFVREDHEKEKFHKANFSLKQANMDAMKNMIWMQPIMTIFMNVTVLAVLWFGGNMVVAEDMKYSELSAFITYVTQILSSLMMVTFMLMTSSRAMASAKRIRQVLDEEPDLNDIMAQYKDLQVQRGEITFKDVTFRYYKDSEDPVLSRVNLTIPAGSTVGIIGSTGCGKTTLVSMIPRFYDPDEGEILVDGVNVKDYSLYHLREGVGMVLQKNVLFSGTIEENLRWGNPDASMQELTAAAESAQAHKFVTGFAGGYQTDLGQGGSNVSGGQKQRLCIARALLKKPKILILDDSTSAVDTATEAHIRRAFTKELKHTTKIIIAQRIGSVIEADQIVVMDNGCITGVGTHDQLLASNTEYQEIYYSQMEKKEA